jgi:LuxR family maltose regulon positive regulatory protein
MQGRRTAGQTTAPVERSQERRLGLFPVTKFASPPERPELIERDRILARLHGDLAPQHVLICGPAGSGKSTLAAQWARRPRTAWVSLAADDDQPGQVETATVLAIRQVSPGFGEATLTALRSGADTRVVRVRLVDELAGLEDGLAVVYDDLHMLEGEDALAGLEWLLENVPPSIRLVFCSRETPPWAVSRHEARGVLAVVRFDELRFDAGETERFLTGRLGLTLKPEELAMLRERTDGWAAALYLAALTLRGGASAQQLMAAFDAGDRRVTRYFLAEALDRSDPEEVEFLEALAVLGRFSAELCDAVLDRDDSAERIAALERANLFVIGLDSAGTWFRLHHLFADLLSRRLTQRDSAAAERIHAVAGLWHRDRGDLPSAVSHLLEARRFEEAGALVGAVYPVFLNASRLGNVVARWLEALPDDVIARSPSLCLAGAFVAGVRADRSRMEGLLEQATSIEREPGPMPDGSPSPEAVAAVARTIFHFGDLERSVEWARRADALHGPDSTYRPLVSYVVGSALWRKEGATDEAIGYLRRAAEEARGTLQVVPAVGSLGALGAAHVQRGELEQAEAAARLATERRDALDESALPQMIAGWYGPAWVWRTLGDLERAARDAEMAVTLVRDLPADLDPAMFAPIAFIELGRVRIAQGELADARGLIDHAAARLALTTDPGRLADWLAEARAELAAAGGRGPARPEQGDELSQRELDVLRMLPGSLSLREIGSELFVSHNTVKTHAQGIYRKLGVASRDEAVARARALGLIS